MNGKQLAFEQALHCAKCNARVTLVEECSNPNFSPGEIVLLTCPSTHCSERPWCYCWSCKIRCYRNGLDRHASRKRHVDNHSLRYPTSPSPVRNADTGINASASGDADTEVLLPSGSNDTGNAMALAMEVELMDAAANDEQEEPISTEATKLKFPKMSMEGNNWLSNALKETKVANMQDLHGVFGKPELVHMKNFWAAELASGEGRCGGGLLYLAGKAFQQVKDAQLDGDRFPDFEESRWQLCNLIQYHSMNDSQRKRQSYMNSTLMKFFPPDTFFKHTLIPPFKNLGRYYGGTGQHSMWNNLPVPIATEIDGVAYVSPRAVIAFLMSNGIPIDDIVVTPDYPAVNTVPHHLRRVHNVDESRKATEWFQKIQSDYYGSKIGAPNPNSNSGAPKMHPAVVCLYLSNWSDGFDSAKVKSNRNAIDSKTFTISPPKRLINGTENTFAVALGLKKATGWKKVEALFRKEVEELTSSKEPILFYHGGIQKNVPCFFKEFAVLSDKAERNGLTGTLGCGSDLHRCFGVNGKIQTPSCAVDKIEEFLAKERNGTAEGSFGWSKNFVNGEGNGAVLPSCHECRQHAVRKLLGLTQDNRQCRNCRGWNLLNSENSGVLGFPAHKDYPTSITKGCPVGPPRGRDVFRDGITLPFIPITWDVMKQGCKFAFYQASRKKNYWTKQTTTCYLKHCGVSNAYADLLHATARGCCSANRQNAVDYRCSDRIDDFQFHPNWLCRDLTLHDYIEAVMHQLFLGAAESNYELIGLWLSATPKKANLHHSTFLNVLQVLLKDLRVFNLPWLMAYPLTGKTGTKLGTGSWVAENWICFVRISQFAFGWCCRDPQVASNYGVEDMSRVIIAFYAFVARCLSHAGIDEQTIAETELYRKEFLSALREFDIRVRYQKLGKTVKNVSERKGTEAWWLKSNYMSLCNLIAMMRLIGPLVLWWDGGGKGERFIQLIKPHIKKGVRDDAVNFFVALLEKLYRVRQLDLFEERFGLGDKNNIEEEEVELLELLNQIADTLLPQETNGDSTTSSEEADDDDDAVEVRFEEAYFSANEAFGMQKNKTIYVYRNEKQLNDSVSAKKPLAGTVELMDDGQSFEFYTVHRKPVKQFVRRRVTFDDTNGLFYHGMWCAEVEVQVDEVSSTEDFKQVQSAARMAAVAIPLWYIIGKDKPDSNKYCVITNWWKYRMKDGGYRLPTIHPEMYGEEASAPVAPVQDDYLLQLASNEPNPGAPSTGVI